MGRVHIEVTKITRFLSHDFDYEWKDNDRLEAMPSGQSSEQTIPLTPQGVLDLSKCGYWIYIPEERINDRSKTNQIQKALMLLQVCWLALQCIVRRSYGLPLAPLEVHTVVHVVCAVALYIFWFEVGVHAKGSQQMSLSHYVADVKTSRNLSTCAMPSVCTTRRGAMHLQS